MSNPHGEKDLQGTNDRLSEAARSAMNQLGPWGSDNSGSENVQADVTSWLVKSVKEWMWNICAESCCPFYASDTFSRVELGTLSSQSFARVLYFANFNIYNGYIFSAQQKYLAHLRRHFKKVIQLKHGNNPELRQVSIKLINVVIMAHRSWKEAKDTSTYCDWAAGFMHKVQATIEQWLFKAGCLVDLLLRHLQNKAKQWMYVLDRSEALPENNRCERSLRLMVKKRSRSRPIADSAKTTTLLMVCHAQGFFEFELINQAMISTRLPETHLMPPLIYENSTCILTVL